MSNRHTPKSRPATDRQAQKGGHAIIVVFDRPAIIKGNYQLGVRPDGRVGVIVCVSQLAPARHHHSTAIRPQAGDRGR